VGCKGPTRDFTFAVVEDQGATATNTTSAGKCQPPKKKKK
jgi:hypothetical protein